MCDVSALIYRVSQKKGGFGFQACFGGFRTFKSKSIRKLTPLEIGFYLLGLVFSQVGRYIEGDI